MTTLKVGTLVWNKKEQKQGKVAAILPKGDFKVEIIVSKNEKEGTRTTKLENWNKNVTVVYIKPNTVVKTKGNLKIKVKYFDNELDKLEKISKGDWIDLRAAKTVELKQFESTVIPLGVGMKLPVGYEAHVLPRSSTFKNWGIIQTNSTGVIDNSYSGNNDQWAMPVIALRDTVINKNDRICQFRIVKSMDSVDIVTVEFLDEISRGGFGSTGSN